VISIHLRWLSALIPELVSLSRSNVCRFCKRGFASKGTLETHETLQCVQFHLISGARSPC
jgi:hypothetical protein